MMTRIEFEMQKIYDILDGNKNKYQGMSYKQYLIYNRNKEINRMTQPYNKNNVYTSIFPNQEIMNQSIKISKISTKMITLKKIK